MPRACSGSWAFGERARIALSRHVEAIDRIEVNHIERVGKNRTQRFTIRYKFIGTIEMPEAPKRNNFKLDTRQGVAVEYQHAV